MWSGGDHFSAASDYFLLGIQDGHVQFRFNLGNGEGVLVFNSTRVDDGRWHRIKATRYIFPEKKILKKYSMIFRFKYCGKFFFLSQLIFEFLFKD